MESPLNVSGNLKLPVELPVLSPEMLYENEKYTANLVDLKLLKARLNTLEQPSLAPRKLKEQEHFFFECINAEVVKVNNVCTKAVLEIEDALRYLTRQLNDPDLGKEHAAILQPECDTVLSSICQLEQYEKICEASFAYVMKKHDSIVGSASSAWFETCLQDEYFTNIHFPALILQLGNLYSIVRKKLYTPDPIQVTTGSKKLEKVKLYWVRKDDLLKVQGWILRHMSLGEIHNQKMKERATDDEYQLDPAISVTSIYFDGPKFELYNNFVHALPDSKLVRVSWNGEERTDVRISFQPQSGIAETVPIKYKHIGPFLAGEWRFDQYTQKLLGKVLKLATKCPFPLSLSTKYEFESEAGDVHARLDTWPTVIKESGGGKRWNRDTHATHIKGREKATLHLHLLRITTSRNDIEWLSDLLDLGLMSVVPSRKHPFDYFIYGVAKFYGKQLDTQPSWMQALQEFTHKSSNRLARVSSVGTGLDVQGRDYNSISDFHSVSAYSEWTDSSGDDEEETSTSYASPLAVPPMGLTRSASTRSLATAVSGTQTTAAGTGTTTPVSPGTGTTPVPLKRSAPPPRTLSQAKIKHAQQEQLKSLEKQQQPQLSQPQPQIQAQPIPQAHVQPAQKSQSQPPSQPPPQPPSRVEAPKPVIRTKSQELKQKIKQMIHPSKAEEEITPVRQTVRVEPKTFFSNERTLLQWMNAIVILSTLSITLIGVGDEKSRIAGFILLPVSIIFGLYALGVYHLRLRAISERKNSAIFRDGFGPYMLVTVFLLALVLAAVVPSLQTSVGDNTEAKDYPFVPPILPYKPNAYIFTAPLPPEIFPFNKRNDGVIEVMAMMKIIGDDIKNNVGLISTDLPPESITIINDFTNSLSGPTPTYRMQTRKKGANVVSELDIMSTLPNFKNIKLPVHNNDLGTGHEEFLLSFDCSASSFFYRTSLYKDIQPRDWNDIDNCFKGTINALNLNSTSLHVPLTLKGYSEHTWTRDITIASSPATLSLSLTYNCTTPACPEGSKTPTLDETNTQLPNLARIELFVPEKFRNVETFKASRALMETIINSQFTKWPEC